MSARVPLLRLVVVAAALATMAGCKKNQPTEPDSAIAAPGGPVVN
ncbi:MAG: hypothetical protein R2882_00125 [Gemmatimonadales bacterium]